MGKLADALSEKSKRDDALIVGSEIRAALQELRDEARVAFDSGAAMLANEAGVPFGVTTKIDIDALWEDMQNGEKEAIVHDELCAYWEDGQCDCPMAKFKDPIPDETLWDEFFLDMQRENDDPLRTAKGIVTWCAICGLLISLGLYFFG